MYRQYCILWCTCGGQSTTQGCLVFLHPRGSIDQTHISRLVSKYFALSEPSCQPKALFLKIRCLLDFHEIKHKLYMFLFSGKVNLTLAIWEICAWFPSYWSNHTSAIVQKNFPDWHIKPEMFVSVLLCSVLNYCFPILHWNTGIKFRKAVFKSGIHSLWMLAEKGNALCL